MKNRQKYLLIAFAIIFLLLFAAKINHAAALEIKDYPRIPGLPEMTEENLQGKDALGVYIGYFFGLGTYIVGALAVIFLVIGGIRLAMSLGNPESIKDAREQITGAVIGLVLTLSSFIIIRTINPQLITPTLTPLPGVAGIFYVKGSGADVQKAAAPDSVTDSSEATSNGFTSILYECLEGGIGPDLFVWKYGRTQFRNFQTVQTLQCDQTTSVSPSFKMAYKKDGIYFFLGPGCSGLMSNVYQTSLAQLDTRFEARAKSIKIINDSSNYGFVIHDSYNYTGNCMPPQTTDELEKCVELSISPISIEIFQWNMSDWRSSGDGIVLYSKPYGYRTGTNAGFLKITPDVIKKKYQNARLDKLEFSYANISVPEEEMALCKNFQQCPGSMKIGGDYLVALFSGEASDENPAYCQVFRTTEDGENLKKEKFAPEGRILKKIYVLPTK